MGRVNLTQLTSDYLLNNYANSCVAYRRFVTERDPLNSTLQRLANTGLPL